MYYIWTHIFEGEIILTDRRVISMGDYNWENCLLFHGVGDHNQKSLTCHRRLKTLRMGKTMSSGGGLMV